jgi:hypothetical protein
MSSVLQDGLHLQVCPADLDEAARRNRGPRCSIPLLMMASPRPQGFGFVVMKRGKYMRAASKGRGFVARLPSDDNTVCWSAPSWFHTRVSASGFTTGANGWLPCEVITPVQGCTGAHLL